MNISRRKFLNMTIQAAAVSTIGCAAVTSNKPKTRKNVLLLLFDDLRHDSFGFRGKDIHTPAIDALQSQSVCFDTACSTTGLCSPARAALFTGRWGHRTGLDDNCHVWQSRLKALDMKHTTLIEWAVEKGCFVGYFGKWHIGPDGPILRGVHSYTAKGFEPYGKNPIKTPNFDITKKYYDKTKTFDSKPQYYATRPGTYENSPTAQKARDGIEFIKQAAGDDRPFFLTVSFNAPHPPYIVPKPYDTMYDPQKAELPKSLAESKADKPKYQDDTLWPWHDVGHMTETDWKKLQAHYHGFVTVADKAVGQIINTLKQNNMYENTMIILAGDQGSMLGEHRLYDKGPYCYDELMRTCLLVKTPGIPPRRIKRHVSVMDINKTIVDWLALKPSAPPIDSRSLLPLMKNGDNAWPNPDQAFYHYQWYNGKWYGIRAVRTHSHKYCFNPVGIDELYDLKNDPHEINNLINVWKLRSVKQNLQNELLKHLENIQDPAAVRLKTQVVYENS